MNIEKLYRKLCRKAFRVKPFKTTVRFKKMKKLLAYADYWKGPPSEPLSGLKIRVANRLRFSQSIVAQCLIHEITHVVSRQQKHNNKFYKAYFKAAQTQFARKYF